MRSRPASAMSRALRVAAVTTLVGIAMAMDIALAVVTIRLAEVLHLFGVLR